MANIGFTLRSTFGLLPKTEKIETSRNALEAEYAKLLEFSQSDVLNEYLELEAYLATDEFTNSKKELLALNYKGSKEQKDEQRYLKLKKNKGIANYLKLKDSTALAAYNSTSEGELLLEYKNLKESTQTPTHKEAKGNYKVQLAKEKSKQKELNKLKKDKALKSYFNTLNSAELNNYLELKNSEELNHYLKVKASNTEEDKGAYAELKKQEKFVGFFKFEKSKALANYNTIHGSQKLDYYMQLKEYVESPAYNEALSSYTYENSDEYAAEKRFQELKNHQEIKNWLAFDMSKAYKLYKETAKSDLLKEYNTLDETINSEEFAQRKSYLLDKHKFEKTDDFKKESRFGELKQSEDIKWYFKVKDSEKFDELKAWKLTFEDNFDAPTLPEEKWMNSYFWGKMLLNDRYVLAGDKQFYTDNKNIAINNSTLSIITKKENAEGKVWHPLHGFSQQQFQYTSGMLSTAHSFRQQYGRFEAKIKLNSAFPVYQAFWLKGEKILPEVDVLKFNMDKKNRLQVANFWGEDAKSSQAAKSTLGGSALVDNYFIYSMDWTAEKISWKINGIEVHSSTQGIPNEPLYMVFSSGIHNGHEPSELPASFEIDWVRCYEKAN